MALSLWQPFASLMVAGHKTVETRIVGTEYRGPVAIVAEADADPSVRSVVRRLWHDYEDLRPIFDEELPVGVVVGTARLANVVEVTERWLEAMKLNGHGRELDLGCYTLGRWAFVFTDPKPSAPVTLIPPRSYAFWPIASRDAHTVVEAVGRYRPRIEPPVSGGACAHCNKRTCPTCRKCSDNDCMLPSCECQKA